MATSQLSAESFGMTVRWAWPILSTGDFVMAKGSSSQVSQRKGSKSTKALKVKVLMHPGKGKLSIKQIDEAIQYAKRMRKAG